MSTINELYLEIEDLKKKIEEEPRKRLKRKLMIEDKIKQLEEEKRRSGLHGDFASVQQFNTQIKKLKNESAGGQVYEYESQLKVSKHKLLDLIVDYYNKGHELEDIFQIEDVPQNIQDELLDKSNFGKNTGFLFVDEIDNDKDYSWRYYNPIYDIEYKSKTLDDLEYQINSHQEVYLIFNNDLANKSRNRDLELYQIKIDKYITDLKDCEDIADVFENLKEYKDKFSEKQIIAIYEFLLEDKIDYELMIDFDYILEANLDKLNADTINKIYHDIIDLGINRLMNPDDYNEDIYTRTYFMNDIFDCLKKLSKHFGEEQIMGLSNFLTEKSGNYDYFYDVDYILEDYEDKTFLNKIYQDIIDDGIAKVTDSDYYLNNIFKCLKEYLDYFSKSQIIKLYDAFDDFKYFHYFNSILNGNKDKFDETELNNIYTNIIDKGIGQLEDSEYSPYYQVFSSFNILSDKFSKEQIKRLYDFVLGDIQYADEFNGILRENADKFSQEEMDEIYCGLIDNGIEKLENPNINQNEISDVFDYLNYYSSKFSSKQIQKLCTIVINDIYGFNKGFISILEDSDDEFNDIYKKIINQRINTLKDLNTENRSSKYLIKDLRYLAKKFNKSQLNKLTKVIISNSNICNFADDFIYILKVHDEENNTTYEKIIDTRIKHLSNSDSGLSCTFNDLKVFAYKFNKTQINTFNDIVQDEKYISCCAEDILSILSANKNNLDESYHEKIIEMRINVKLNKLSNIVFGYRDARLILEDLQNYADSFNEAQLIRLCNISITNSQVYNCDYCESSLRHILSENKDKIDKELYEETILRNNL